MQELFKISFLAMMKKLGFAVLSAMIFYSCHSPMDKAMKSADKDFILKVANDFYAQKKWSKALELYDRLPNLVAGTDDAPNVTFNSAYANYYQKNYRLAGHQFKNFSVAFSGDSRKEEAAYMAALCYYQGSLEYNLDQTNTNLAINEIQDFINTYPNSERVKNLNTLIDELSNREEFKYYQGAKQYFKMANYKAAVIAFENLLDEYPATKNRQQIYEYILKSKYELAVNSRFDLKEERIENAIAYTGFIEKESTESGLVKLAQDLSKKLENEKISFQKLKKEVEENKALNEEKLKKIQEKEEQREQKKNQIKNQKMKQDSAKSQTPTSGTTFKIRR